MPDTEACGQLFYNILRLGYRRRISIYLKLDVSVASDTGAISEATLRILRTALNVQGRLFPRCKLSFSMLVYKLGITFGRAGDLYMGQKPIAVRIKTDADSGGAAPDIVTVGEAARRLGVSERTVFRLLKTGELERVDRIFTSDIEVCNDRHKSMLKQHPDRAGERLSKHMTDMNGDNASHSTAEQLKRKDAQIADLLKSQQEMAQTIGRLQEQMYELAHLVLSHNAAAAQARAEAELKLQEQANAASRRGMMGLIAPRTRK